MVTMVSHLRFFFMCVSEIARKKLATSGARTHKTNNTTLYNIADIVASSCTWYRYSSIASHYSYGAWGLIRIIL